MDERTARAARHEPRAASVEGEVGESVEHERLRAAHAVVSGRERQLRCSARLGGGERLPERRRVVGVRGACAEFRGVERERALRTRQVHVEFARAGGEPRGTLNGRCAWRARHEP